MYAIRAKLPAHISEEDIRAFSASLSGEDFSVSIRREADVDASPWIVEWFAESRVSEDEAAALIAGSGAEFTGLSIEEIPSDIDWLKESYRGFPSFSVGPFFIHGSHHEGAVPDGQAGLKIDAATAFGSGEHGTTKGCLRALLDLKGRGACPWNVLDMGTGSGILAIAAWKLWKTPVLAVDNDLEAVRVAARHRDMNGVPAVEMTCEAGDGFKTPAVAEKGPFDLIIANILAVTLKDMARDLAAAADENGYVVLSGILKEQAAEVLEVYHGAGFKERARYDVAAWTTLLLQNAAA